MMLTNTGFPEKSQTIRATFIVCQIVMMIFLVLLHVIFSNVFDQHALILPESLVLLGLFLWLIWSWKVLSGRWFDPYTLFIVSAFAFNGARAVLEIFGLNKSGILGVGFTDELTINTLQLVILGLASFHLGALIGYKPSKMHANHQPEENKHPQIYTLLIGWFLLLISIVPALVVMREKSLVSLQAGYASLYQAEASTSFNALPNVLASFLIPGSYFLLAGSDRRHSLIIISLVAVLVYSFVQIFLVGVRGWGILALIGYVWLWHRTVRPLPLIPVITVSIVIFFFVFPVIAITRNARQEDRTVSSLINEFTSIDNPAISSLSEMGATIKTVAYTLDLVPSSRDFDEGTSYLYALTTAFPNFFWEIHPAIAHGLPSHWLILSVDPYTAARGGGLGFSFIAEAYFNFGWLGTPVLLALIGFGFAKLIEWAHQPERPDRLACLAVCTSFFLFYARSETAIILRPLFWYALFPYIAVNALRALREKYAPNLRKIAPILR